MARYIGAVCRMCRRESKKLFLKGERCFSEKCSVAKRNYSPGQHGQMRKKLSEYGLQLRAKQMTKRFYGILEKQFSNYFKLAERKTGVTGENLLNILNSRLDNVIFTAGFAGSRAQARQMILHNHFTLNGKKVNIASVLVKPGDVIEVSQKSRSKESFKSILEQFSSKPTPKWLSVNREAFKIVVDRQSTREDIELDVAEHLIVELYSK